jgi:phenylacetate-CoA ligase
VLVRNVIAPLWAWQERSPYLRVAAALARRERLSLDERLSRQWSDLKDIVDHAWRESPYYKRSFGAVGFEPGDLKSWKDLGRLPLLTKPLIREYRDEIVPPSWTGKTLWPRKTSGSTGVSLEFFVDEDCLQWKRGVALYRDWWTGWDLGEYRAMVWGNPPPRHGLRRRLRNHLLDKSFFLDTLRMDERMMADFARLIRTKRPTLLFGHAHSLYLFAKFWRSQGTPGSPFKGVVSSAMVLHEHERREIEASFGCKVFDRYGCEEVSLIASECQAHRGLHVNTDSLVVEVIPDPSLGLGGGNEGAVVVTDLKNRGMPFIRYRVEDLASRSPGPCPCGRSYPLLERITGRVADYLYTTSGEWVSGISLTENFATLIPGVRQVQIVQDDWHHLEIRIVPESSYDEASRSRISSLVAERFGPGMRYSIQIVERVLPEASGKYRFAICRIPGRETPPEASNRPEPSRAEI